MTVPDIRTDYADLSLGAYFVTSRYGKTELSTATAFFVTRDSATYLVTNWHVVTGRDANTGKCLSATGGVPDNLLVRMHLNSKHIEFADLEVRLLDQDAKPLWKEHPVHGGTVDVVAIKMDVPSSMTAKSIDDLMEPLSEEARETVASDVFILGYPFGLSAEEFFPIWKRASIATEPAVEVSGLPKMLVDTASRQGMSGAPVVLYSRRPTTLLLRSPKDPTKQVISRYETKLVGIYSGRIGAEDVEFKAQLGMVWKARVIDEIITGNAVIHAQY